MPLVQISVVAGRDAAALRHLLEGVTDTVVEALDVKPEQVRVLLYELPASHWAVAGKPKDEEEQP